MSIVTFWNDGEEQVGKTLTSVAVATKMAIERNFKILLISTSYKDATMKNCFWEDNIQKKSKLFGVKESNIAVESGIEGLSKLINSNKIQPNIITDYTKVILKDRLEVLNGYKGIPEKTEDENLFEYKKLSECYVELLELANQYYDMVVVDVDNALSNEVKQEILRISNLKMVVLVDIDNKLDKQIKDEILKISNLNVLVLTQRLKSLKKYNAMKESNKNIIGPKCMVAIGKYDNESKYNKKNITRYLEERKNLNIIPYNTLFFEAAEETEVVELFLKLRNIKDINDKNYFFMAEVLNLTNNIITRLQELQMKMR